MREPPNIPEAHLRACLQNQYGLLPLTCEFLPLGLDSHAGVYRVEDQQGNVYLLKVTSRPHYEASYFVPRYLHDQGISAVVAPQPTKNNTLWTHLEHWTVIVYPFIEGDTSWMGMTAKQWSEVGGVLRQIHQISLPLVGFASLRKETFDATNYTRLVHEMSDYLAHTRYNDSDSARALHSSWTAHQPTIHEAVTYLEKLAAELQRQTHQFVICHADLHPANLLRAHDGHVFVIDWDEVMLAPKERDFILLQGMFTHGSFNLSDAPFFHGYGQTEVNWLLFTYYLYERAIQDLIVCAQEVLFRDDLGEETKAVSVALFHEVWAHGGEMEMASIAATQLS